jgi:hypothetical protein
MPTEIIEGYPFVFYGEVFNAYLATDRQWYLPVARLCEAVEIDANGQLQRIRRDEALADALVELGLEMPYGETTRKRAVYCLNLRRLPYWLGTIDASRVKEDVRAKVVRFKRDFAEAAWQVFRSDFMPEDVLAEMDAFETPAQQELSRIFDEAAALRRRLAGLDERISSEVESLSGQLDDVAGRLGSLEVRFAGREFINPDQQHKLQKMVNTLAMARYEASPAKSKSKYFAESYADFKAEFKVPIYAMLSEDQFPAAVDFLRSRWQFYLPGQPLPSIFEQADQGKLF